MLDAARARDHPEPWLGLTEDRRFACGEPHVAGQHEFAAGATDAPFDLRDAHEAACAQMVHQEPDRRLPASLAAAGRYSMIRVTSTWEMK